MEFRVEVLWGLSPTKNRNQAMTFGMLFLLFGLADADGDSTMPSSRELVELAQHAYDETAAEDRSMIRDDLLAALIATGQDERAFKVASEESQYAVSYLSSEVAPLLACRTGRVPNDEVLDRIAEKGSKDRDVL